MTYQFTCCIETLWTFTANMQLHTFMSKYVLGWCSVILIVDTPRHPHYQFQSLPPMNCLHIHTITNTTAQINNNMQTVIALHCSKTCWKQRHNMKNIIMTDKISLRSATTQHYEPLTTTLKFGQRCFSHVGHKAWNSLLHAIQKITDSKHFQA